MLGTAQSNALGAETAGELSVLRIVGVRTHTQGAELVCPLQDGVQIASELRHDQLDRAEDHDALGAVNGDHIAFLNDDVGARDSRLLLLGIDLESLDAANARRTHAAGDNGSMAGLAAMAGQDAFGGDHAGKVVGRGLPADQNALSARLGGGNRVSSGEDRLANGSAGAGVQAARDDIVVGVLVELRVQQLVKLIGIDAHDGLFLGDEALFDHLDRNMQRGGGGALADARLEHPQLALFDRELDIAHIAEVVLEDHEHFLELVARFLETLNVFKVGDGARVANAGDNVFALGVDQIVAIELLRAVGGIAGKRDASGGGVALVAEHHGLHVNGGAQVIGDLVLLAVQRRTRVVPAAEHGLDSKLQLDHRILRELNDSVDDQAGIALGGHVLREDVLEFTHQLLQVFSGQVGVGCDTADVLHGGDGVFEKIAVKAHHDVGEHLDEAPITIPCEAGILGLLDEAVDGLVVQAKVEHRVHHAGHRHRSAGAHRNQQGVLRIADLLANAALKIHAVLVNSVERAFGPYIAGVGVLHASLARDGETGRNGKSDIRHLRKVGALATKDRLHVGVALGNVVALGILAERVNALHFFGHHIFSLKRDYPFIPTQHSRMVS